MVVFQRPHLKLHAPVFVEEVDGAQHRAVAGLLPHVRDLRVKFLLVHLAQDFFPKNAATFFISIGIAAYSSVKSA